jgi:hypothetical protein
MPFSRSTTVCAVDVPSVLALPAARIIISTALHDLRTAAVLFK